MVQKLAGELQDAAQSRGGSVKKRETPTAWRKRTRPLPLPMVAAEPGMRAAAQGLLNTWRVRAFAGLEGTGIPPMRFRILAGRNDDGEE